MMPRPVELVLAVLVAILGGALLVLWPIQAPPPAPDAPVMDEDPLMEPEPEPEPE
ncbi:MAG TPA: M23 family peptidase, partial [Oceanicaulis sp.]|nr:M23 family peptidase [Oceanicaulis sp.]